MSSNPFEIHVAGTTGHVVGPLHTLQAAHRIAHRYLAAWPELSPLTLTGRTRHDSWTIEASTCSPLVCGIAHRYAAYRGWVSHQETLELMNDPDAQRDIDEAMDEYARGEFTTGEEARARFGLPPVPQPPHADHLPATRSGLPIRIPATIPAWHLETLIDPALLRRVLDRLRRLQ